MFQASLFINRNEYFLTQRIGLNNIDQQNGDKL